MADDPNVSIDQPGASTQDYLAAITEYMRESANPVDTVGRLESDSTPQLPEPSRRPSEIPSLRLWIATTVILVTLYVVLLTFST